MIAGVALRTHVYAALRESFLDHGGDVHEGLDHDAGDPFGKEPTETLLLPRQLTGCQCGECADAEVTLGADVLPKIHGPRVGQRGLLA